MYEVNFLAIVGFGVSLVISIFVYMLLEKWPKDSAGRIVIGIIVFVVCMAANFTLAKTILVVGPTYVFSREGVYVGTIPEGRGIRLGHEFYSDDYQYLEIKDRTFTVSSSVGVITEKANVRNVGYTVTVEIGSYPESLSLYIQKFGAPPRRRYSVEPYADSQFVQSLLYDFNNDNAVVFADLFNPLRPSQQKNFADSVIQAINPSLSGTGLTITSVEFSLS